MPRGAESKHTRAKRGAVVGWTADAVRRHTKFLYSVDAGVLLGFGYALTLTVGNCPPSAAEWASARRAFLKRLERRGIIRSHWVTEWQRRGVPHMHMAVYFERELSIVERWVILAAWAEIVESYGCSLQAQDMKPIDGATGWLQYLSKHAARGVAHYQRQGKPEGWETTGRLWGKTGEWPTDEALRFDVSRESWYRVRRIVRRWRIADARKEKDPKNRARRIRSARRMLRGREAQISAVRGVSEWLGQDDLMRILALLGEQGAEVIQTDG